MSIPVVDYRMPVTVDVVVEIQNGRTVTYKIRRVDILSIEEAHCEFSEEEMPEIRDKGGVTFIRTIHGLYTAVGNWRSYHDAWCGYRNYLIKNEEKFRFYLPVQ